MLGMATGRRPLARMALLLEATDYAGSIIADVLASACRRHYRHQGIHQRSMPHASTHGLQDHPVAGTTSNVLPACLSNHLLPARMCSNLLPARSARNANNFLPTRQCNHLPLASYGWRPDSSTLGQQLPASTSVRQSLAKNTRWTRYASKDLQRRASQGAHRGCDARVTYCWQHD